MKNLKAAFARFLVKQATKPQYNKFISASKDVKNAQQAEWKLIYEKTKNSKFWNGKSSPRLEDYPITEYKDYEDALVENRSNITSAFNGEEIIFWIKSGGTTGDEKLFPLTKAFKDQYQQTLQPFAHSLYKRLPDLGKKPILYFAAPRDLAAPVASGVKAGYMSTYNYDNMPSLLKSLYHFPDDLLDTQEGFSKLSAHYALSSDLSAMLAVTPLAYIRMIQKINAKWEEILKDLQGGIIPISQERLDYLKSLKKTELTFKKLWPSLAAMVCWQSSLCALQMASIAEYTQGVKLVDAIFSASEGWVTCPIENEVGGPIHPRSGVFEFIEVGQEITPENIIKPWELKPGSRYEILITNSMGLIRYRIKDVVECSGFFNQSPKIFFHSKADRTLSLGVVTLAETELASALSKTKVDDFQNWRFGPSKTGDQIVLYTDREVQDAEKLSLELEESLKEVNNNYMTYRKNNGIQHLKVEFLPVEFRQWQKKLEHAQTKASLLIDYDPRATR